MRHPSKNPAKPSHSSLDRGVQDRAQQVLEGRGRGLRRLAPFFGPAFVAAVAYVDPGNFATNIQGGAAFGYRLLWVVLWANLIGMLVQALSAKLGVATGKNLPEVIRERYPRKLVWFYWVQAELVNMSTDLAEFLGAALGFQLLFGLPLIWGGLFTAAATFAILGLEHYGFRPLEAVITVLIGVIAGAYVLELFLSRPLGGALYGLVVPSFQGTSSVYLAAGILGATVMPHVIYLHSALTQKRIVLKDPHQKRRLYRFTLIDVVVAMGVAGFVNMAMLVMAAATFHFSGYQGVADITTAFETLTPLLGPLAGASFAISLLAAGLSSSAVGTMAGQVTMQGFVGFTMPLWLRRAVTMLPSLVIIVLGLNPTTILILSQVILSFGIPFAIIPLLQFTRKREIVGELVNSTVIQGLGWLIAAVIIVLNIFLLYQTVFAGHG